MYKVIGIDEAGKGPVLGSLFIGFSIINLIGLKDLNSYEETLRKIGVKDSKLLSPKMRNKIYNELKTQMDIKYVQLTPALIDNNFNSGSNLNKLEIEGIVRIIKEEKPDLVMIDALTANPEKFKQEILSSLDFEPKIIAENKADSTYAIVGAASIIAKELREQEIAQIKQNINKNCGSGYPADPYTKKFLEANYDSKEFDFIFRKTWKTYTNLLKRKKEEKSKNLFDY